MLYSIVQFYWCSGVRLLRKNRVAFPKDQRQEIRRVRREVQFSREICLSSGGIFSDMKWPLLFGKWFPEWTKLCDEKFLMKEREVINNNESSLYRFSRPDWVYSWSSVCMKVWSVVPYINRQTLQPAGAVLCKLSTACGFLSQSVKEVILYSILYPNVM